MHNLNPNSKPKQSLRSFVCIDWIIIKSLQKDFLAVFLIALFLPQGVFLERKYRFRDVDVMIAGSYRMYQNTGCMKI